jgi:hypothetical protein
MQPANSNSFDIQPIMTEVEKVIQCGLNKLLVNYIERHELLERTHQHLLQLPSIIEEFQLYNRKTTNLTKESATNSLQIYDSQLEERLVKVEKRLDAVIPILDKLLSKITHLNDDIQDMRNEKEQTTSQFQVNNAEKSSVVKTSENENIEIHIEENVETEEEEEQAVVEEQAVEEQAVEVEVEEEEVEDEEVEDVEEQEEEEEGEVVEEEEQEVEEEGEEVEEQEDEEDEEQEQEQEVEEKVIEEQEQEQEEEVEEQEEEASIETETKDKEEEEEDDEELFEIEIDDKTYCTNNDENGFIWELTDDGEQGEKVGYLKDGEPFFYADEN